MSSYKPNPTFDSAKPDLSKDLSGSEYTRQRVTLSAISILIVVLVAGGGRIKGSGLSVFGSSIIIDRPIVLIVALAAVFLYSSWRFRHLSHRCAAGLVQYIRWEMRLQERWQLALSIQLDDYHRQNTSQYGPYKGVATQGILVTRTWWTRGISFKRLQRADDKKEIVPRNYQMPDFELKFSLPAYVAIYVRALARVLVQEKIGTDYVVPILLMLVALLCGSYRVSSEILRLVGFPLLI